MGGVMATAKVEPLDMKLEKETDREEGNYPRRTV